MDKEAQQPNRWPPSSNAMDRSRALVDYEIAFVATSIERKVVINVSDIESYGSKHQLIGDSTNEDSDNDDKGVTQRVEMSVAPEPRALQVDAPSVALIKASPTSTPAIDKFYNAVEQASPHPNVIVLSRNQVGRLFARNRSKGRLKSKC